MGTFLLTYCTGGTKGSRQMVYTPGILPVVSNDWGNAFLKKLQLAHLLQKHGPEMNCFLWHFEWENGLGRECYGPVMKDSGPVMIVPVVKNGLGKYCCQWYFASRLTSASVTALGCFQLVCWNTKVC